MISIADYDISGAFAAIEKELMTSMIRNMKRHRIEEIKEEKQWSMWQTEQLRALQKYKQINGSRFKKPFADINSSIDAIISAARVDGNMSQEIAILKAIKQGWKPPKQLKSSMQTSAEFFKLNDRKLDALIKATTKDMKKAETAILRMAEDKYRQIIFNAQVYANSGAGTYEKAVDMATKNYVSKGINCIEYANGARHTIEDYADMAIRTAAKRAYLAGEGEMRQKWGISTVIVNKCGNPCPKCLPFCGKIFIDDVWSGGKASDEPYPLLSVAIEAGLYHPRCKDSHTTYFPGISTLPDTKFAKQDLDNIAAEYKKEQEQKYAKRQANRFKKLAKNSLDSENQKKYEIKANEWEEKYKKFSKEPEFLAIKNWADVDIGMMTEWNREMSLIPEKHQRILEEAGVEVEFIKDGVSHYDPRDRVVYIKNEFEAYEGVHEMAHALEDVEGIWDDPKFCSLVGSITSTHAVEEIIDDRTTYVKPVKLIKDDRLVSEYQGRLYEQAGLTVDNKINPDAMWDYLSEGYRCFIESPDLLKEKDIGLYNYIKEWCYE